MKIILYTHPLSGEPPETFETGSLAGWLLDRYDGRMEVPFELYAGEPSLQTNIRRNANAILRSDCPVYTVLERPAGPLLPILVNMAIATVLSVIARQMFAPIPPLADRDQGSPNNQLSNRQNRVRAMERVEDIFGIVKAIPSMLMPTYNKYIAHQKVEFGYYCVGRGYYDVSDIKDGDTLLSEMTGASAAVYQPFSSPNSGAWQLLVGDPIIDPILTVTRSSSVDGITLKPQNQLQPTPGLSYFFRGPGSADLLPASTLDVIYQPAPDSRKPNFAAIAAAGQTLTIPMSDTGVSRELPVTHSLTAVASTKTITSSLAGFFRGVVNGSTITIPEFLNGTNNTAKTIVSHTASSITVAEALADEVLLPGAPLAVGMFVNYSSSRTINTVDNGYVILSGAVQFYEGAAELLPANITVGNGLTDWTDWFTLPAADRTEVWTNVLAAAGMYKDDGAKSGTSVSYEVQIEQLTALLVPTGTVETVTGTISGSTSAERAETLERVTGWTGPARVRARRTTPFDYDFSGAVVDEIRWMDLYGVSPVTKPHFENKTTIHTVRKAAGGRASGSASELNCIAGRKLPIFNGATFSGAFGPTGALASGTIGVTSRIVDIIAAVSIDPQIGARTITDLDMAQIWATQQALDAWHSEAGQFNYTFDTDSVSFEETLTAIARAAFCMPFRQSGKIRLALDRPQANSVGLFTHRNKRPNAETITRRFASDADYDGVEFIYQDPETQDQETIRLPVDGSYTKLKKVEITGVRSFEQAWFHANREYARLIFQRLSIETDTTTDARALLPNSRIDIVDNTRFKSYDGEVIAQSGLTLTLSRDVVFLPATAHSIVLMKRDGSIQSITCTEVAGAANKVLLAAPPGEALITTPTADDGIRTIFSFGPDSARAAQAWLVQEIGATEGDYVRIRAVNYSSEYYAADALAIPAKESVIN